MMESFSRQPEKYMLDILIFSGQQHELLTQKIKVLKNIGYLINIIKEI